MSGRTVDVGDLVAPDPARSLASEGRRILQDAKLLVSCFCADDKQELTTFERLGTLKKWWRLIERCYSVVAVFEHFAASNSKRSMVAWYSETVLPLEGACSYTQATRLERIGRLLQRFPRLRYQTQLTSIRDWMGKVTSTGSALVDSLEKLLSANDVAFWEAQDVDEHYDDVCVVCGASGDGLWNCIDCSCWFHETCVGYKA